MSSGRTSRRSARRRRERRKRRSSRPRGRLVRNATGYVATTIQDIADEAEVAVQTVYAVFGNKRELLRQVLEAAVSGGAGAGTADGAGAGSGDGARSRTDVGAPRWTLRWWRRSALGSRRSPSGPRGRGRRPRVRGDRKADHGAASSGHDRGGEAPRRTRWPRDGSRRRDRHALHDLQPGGVHRPDRRPRMVARALRAMGGRHALPDRHRTSERARYPRPRPARNGTSISSGVRLPWPLSSRDSPGLLGIDEPDRPGRREHDVTDATTNLGARRFRAEPALVQRPGRV